MHALYSCMACLRYWITALKKHNSVQDYVGLQYISLQRFHYDISASESSDEREL